MAWWRRLLGLTPPAPPAPLGVTGQPLTVQLGAPGYRRGRTEARLARLDAYLAEKDPAGTDPRYAGHRRERRRLRFFLTEATGREGA